jgi:predicted nucleotidyltransferase
MSVSAAALARTLAARVRDARAAHEADRARAIAALTEICAALVREGAIDAAWLIGSAAWGGFGMRSDLDVVVSGLAAHRATPLSDALAQRTQMPVDLLLLEQLEERFAARVLRDGVRLA